MFNPVECGQRLRYLDENSNEITIDPLSDTLVLATVNNRFTWRVTLAPIPTLKKMYDNNMRDVFKYMLNSYLRDNLEEISVGSRLEEGNVFCRLSFVLGFKLYSCSQIITIGETTFSPKYTEF